MKALHVYEKDDLRIEIYCDDNAANPRKEFSQVGTLMSIEALHLDDETKDRSAEDVEQRVKQLHLEGAVVCTVYRNNDDTLSIKPFSGYTRNIGVIYATPNTLAEHGISPETAKTVFEQELIEFNHYCNGEVYGYIKYKKEICEKCKHVELQEIDSCWGFYGYDWHANGLLQMLGIEGFGTWTEIPREG